MDNVGKTYAGVLGDEYSYVTLEGTLPDPMRGVSLDDWVVKGARVSFRGRPRTKDEDAGLIKRLVSHDHSSPLEQPHLTFSLRLPGAVVVHLLRHRTFHVNGESSRFKEPKDEYYYPKTWRKQDTVNKQGSAGEIEHPHGANLAYTTIVSQAFDAYERAIALGVAREQARLFLPTDALYKSYVITVDLRNFLHFVGLRAANDAQWETQQYACAMFWLIADMAPATVGAWLETIAPSTQLNLKRWKEAHGDPVTASAD